MPRNQVPDGDALCFIEGICRETSGLVFVVDAEVFDLVAAGLAAMAGLAGAADLGFEVFDLVVVVVYLVLAYFFCSCW